MKGVVMDEKKLHIVGDKPLWDEELRSWLDRYIKEHPHHSTQVLARSDYIGVPRAILEDYLEGSYYLPTESGGQDKSSRKHNVEEAVRRFRESVEGTIRHNYANTFVETRTWVEMQNACNTAIRRNAIVVVYGLPGVGKTRCLLEYQKRNMVTSPITIFCSRNISVSYFIEKIAHKLGMGKTGMIAQLEDAVSERLIRYPRPFFIDQGNYLPERSLGTLCYIWERACLPIVIAGTKSLYDSFMTSKLTEEVRSQLSSRVAMHYPLSSLSLSESKAIIQRALGDAATDEAVAQIHNITGGIFRHLDLLIQNLIEFMALNTAELKSGRVKLSELIAKAGTRLMIG